MIFNFCPDCGSACTKTNFKTFKCNSCGLNFYDEPSVCAAVLVNNSEGKCLFQTRNFDPGKGTLGLPGGFVDNNESLEEAIVRECLEEAKINLINIKYFGSYHKNHKIIGTIVSAYFTAYSEDKGEADGNETTDVLWLTKSQIDLNKIGLEDQRKFVEDCLRNS